MSEVLLARFADCIFWLARYVERVENLARILDVNETFSRDSHGGQNWRSIVQLNSDEERFFARAQYADTDWSASLAALVRNESDPLDVLFLDRTSRVVVDVLPRVSFDVAPRWAVRRR